MGFSASYLLDKINLQTPSIGVYDAPEETEFGKVATPPEGRHSCYFAHYKKWLKGQTVKLSQSKYGCRGCANWMFNKTTMNRMEYIDFLVEDEGLKATHEDMGVWLDKAQHYKPEHGFLFIGPLHDKHWQYLKTVTFFVNPDQLSVLTIGAQYFHRLGEPEPVLAPFGSGCGQMLSLFNALDIPQAIIGATDLAMRKYLPPDIMAFTVTVPMYEQLCSIDDNSFLNKAFFEGLLKARKGKL